MTTAKVFMTGRSQAVRIPKRFRFESPIVFVRQEGDSLILSPPSGLSPWKEFFESHVCPDFALERDSAQATQERELFG